MKKAQKRGGAIGRNVYEIRAWNEDYDDGSIYYFKDSYKFYICAIIA